MALKTTRMSDSRITNLSQGNKTNLSKISKSCLESICVSNNSQLPRLLSCRNLITCPQTYCLAFLDQDHLAKSKK